jgi:hypothetical protein
VRREHVQHDLRLCAPVGLSTLLCTPAGQQLKGKHADLFLGLYRMLRHILKIALR